MLDYGFIENTDYIAITQKRVTAQGNETTYTDHALKLDMAKEIAILQRSEKGKEIRQYFIQIEKEYNSPEKIMARALNIANKQLETLTLANKQQEQIINELQSKATYYDLILQCKYLLSPTQIAKDYGKSATWLNKKLKDLGVQYQHRNTWLLYAKYADKGYTSSTTHDYADSQGVIHSRLHTYWTQKGRLFIYEKLKSIRVLPLMELNNVA